MIDFAAASTDPAALNPIYDSGDHLHPNDTGTQAMANAVDLSVLCRNCELRRARVPHEPF